MKQVFPSLQWVWGALQGTEPRPKTTSVRICQKVNGAYIGGILNVHIF